MTELAWPVTVLIGFGLASWHLRRFAAERMQIAKDFAVFKAQTSAELDKASTEYAMRAQDLANLREKVDLLDVRTRPEANPMTRPTSLQQFRSGG